MYWTPDGERVLLGAERTVFEESLGMMVDELDVSTDGTFGVEPFDQLQHGQKLYALYRAGRALLMDDEPMPELTAYLEAAVAAVYRYAYDQIVEEIDDPDIAADAAFSWRSLVMAAIIQRSGVDDELPAEDCTDHSEWQLLVGCLEDGVLWDSDYESETGLDADPDTSRGLKDMLGIPDDYYTEVPFDVPDDQVNLYLDALRWLTARTRGR